MAYTLALIAAGRADATWDRAPKAEWDIAAGAALITAAGGYGRPPPRALTTAPWECYERCSSAGSAGAILSWRRSRRAPSRPPPKRIMPVTTRYLFAAAMDVAPDKEALFNEVYDREHVPNLLAVPGVVSAVRLRTLAFRMSIGGEIKTIAAADPTYTALYEVEGPDVLLSPRWAAAVEAGRWPTQVRPFTRNRRHVLYERL